MVTITFQLSQAGQKASLLAGVSGAAQQTRIVDKDCTVDCYARAIALATVDSAGVATIKGFHFYGNDPKYKSWDYSPTTEELIADIERVRREQAEQQAAEKAAQAQRDAERNAEFQSQIDEALRVGPTYFLVDEVGWTWRGLSGVKAVEHLAEQAKAMAAQNAARRQAEKKAAEAAALLPLREWSLEHGSDLLRARIEGGFDWQSLARAEFVQSVIDGLGD